MITKDNIDRLDKLVAKYAMQDFLRVNTTKNGTIRKRHVPYSLSPLTNEAREMLILARKEDITIEEEEIVKAYLLKKKMTGEEE